MFCERSQRSEAMGVRTTPATGQAGPCVITPGVGLHAFWAPPLTPEPARPPVPWFPRLN